MHSISIHFNPILFSFYTITLVPILIHQTLSITDDRYTSCGNLYNCGNITSVDYPFWGNGRPSDCGHPGLELKCQNNISTVDINSVTYRVLNIHPNTQQLNIAREDYYVAGLCPSKLIDTTLDMQLFDYDPNYTILKIYYGCPMGIFNCSRYGSGFADLSGLVPTECNASVSSFAPLTSYSSIGDEAGLERILKEGFGVKWKVGINECDVCTNSNGRCGYDTVLNQTRCLCSNQSGWSTTCGQTTGDLGDSPFVSAEKKSSSIVPIAVGVSAASAAILVLCLIFIYMRKRKQQAIKEQSLASESKSKGLPTPNPSSYFSQSIPSYPSSNIRTDLEKGSTYFGVQVFTDTELEEATNNFDATKILGDGGFGTVYYGTLRDGRIVAVKRLFENNFKRVEQFMNEVEILTRLRHKNLVTLFGCTSRRSRELLLVYEYIPNGTVADHVHGKHSNSGLLTWPVRLSIAIETADALAYLHRSDVIHRDVKTNNILLDNEFRVKVADFGLSRLFPTDVTHISTAPQGTPGYVDPEYYQCYQLTEKSDVYSYGVVLMELVSSKLAVDTSRHRHDINLANMAVNKIQNQTLDELVDSSIGFHTDEAVKRKVTMVCQLAFRCLQPERDMRPTMEEVLEALREIEKKDFSAENQEVVDIGEDYVGLLKNELPPVLPDEKWVSNTTTPNSSSG